MRLADKKLSLEERLAADHFFERIGETDSLAVRRLVKVVNSRARSYFYSWEIERVAPYFQGCEVFFAVYGIGGNLTKEGERPDVDVMVVTNMRYKKGFMDDFETDGDFRGECRVEPLCRKIYYRFRSTMNFEITGKIPDNYNLGVTGGKCLITLTPFENGRKIDVVYVKSVMAKGSEFGKHNDQLFLSEKDFISKDIDAGGNQLPKVLLYRAKAEGNE
ncbi:MAG: hypothetical protein Q8Q01_04910 [archaeon]|nr:hypothetical protein [archaeon]